MKSLHYVNRKAGLKSGNLLVFLFPMFFVLLADSALSYAFPIIVEENVRSTSVLGLIMAASSLVGFIFDILIPKFFYNAKWYMLFILGIISSMLYPISIYLGVQYESVLFFLFASGIWGIYFEFIAFSQQDYIVEEEVKRNYSSVWGLMNIVWEITTILGPLLAAYLMTHGIFHLSFNLVAIQGFALVFSILIIFKNRKRKTQMKIVSHVKSTVFFVKELKTFGIIGKKLLPVMFVHFLAISVFAMYWTIGGIFGLELTQNESTSWILLGTFNFSILIGSTFIAYAKISKHKKLYSQIALIISGLILSLMFLFETRIGFYFITFLSGLVLALVIPLNGAVFSDLAQRSGDEEMYILSLERMMSSWAYILSPLFVGFIAEVIDYKYVFSTVGIIVVLFGIIPLLVTPKKIRLPHSELKLLK